MEKPPKVFKVKQRRKRGHILFHANNYYLGSMKYLRQNFWVYENNQMVYRPISYVPGLYKIFDEILVGAVGNKQRGPSMDSLKVTIDPGANTVSVYNNGYGFPVVIHKEEKAYVPELIFGRLLTHKGVGHHSFCATLTNIFSTEFIIETADGLNMYKQVFKNNMGMKSHPEITKCKANESWTKLTFKPDLKKFKMFYLEEDVVALMRKRVLDMAVCLGKTVKVELDGQLVRIINSFEDYADLHMKSAEKSRPADAIELVFSEKKVEDRKTCIRDFEPGTFPDHADILINYKDLFNKELMLFSMADLHMSIPSLVDGLKPALRSILFCSFKKKLCEKINVGQLIGYLSEHFASDYGEQSLNSRIIGMAQNFVGSNNINLLKANGHFGTRYFGCEDHASAEYIYIKLNPVTRCLFHEIDDKLLHYLNEEDGWSIETNWYIPIIPLVLVNGSEGIGAGWSSYIPSYNPRKIIANVKRLLNGEKMVPMDPWYRGFRGNIEESDNKGDYIVEGTVEHIGDQIFKITELPIRKWTQDYKEFLESITEGAPNVKDPLIEDFWINGGCETVDIKIKIKHDKKHLIMQEGPHKLFELTTTISTSNMYLFDSEGKIKKFDNPEQILEEFFPLRLEYYEKRKAYLKHLRLILDNKERFILGVVTEEIIVTNRKKADLLLELKQKGFNQMMPRKKGKAVEPQVAGKNDDNSEAQEDGYEYLLSLPIRTLTWESVQKLLAEKDKKKQEFDDILKTPTKSLWMTDLDELEKKLDEMDTIEEERKKSSQAGKKAANVEPENDNTSTEVGILKTTPTNSLWNGSVEPQIAGENDDNSEVTENGYLLSLPIRTLTFEGVQKLQAYKDEKKKEIDNLKATSIKSLWMTDLDELLKKYDEIDSKEAEEERKRSSHAGEKTADAFATTKKTKNVEPQNDNTSMEVENEVEVITVVLDTDSENEVNDVIKKRNVGTKRTLGQKLLTDMLQPAEGTGVQLYRDISREASEEDEGVSI